MFSNLTDRHFEQIGNMATTPYTQLPEYELNPYTTQNFVIGIALEKYQNKLNMNEKLRKEYNDFIFSDKEMYNHTWNYDERIVKPAEYLFLTKIIIPENKTNISSKHINIKPDRLIINNNDYDNDSFLLCTETFSTTANVSTPKYKSETNTPFTPRRPKIFKHGMHAFNNIDKVTKSSNKIKPHNNKADTKKSYKKINDTKKPYKKINDTKKSHKKKL
jgi:hypothetical protein